jgi:hypothetical protein
VSTYLGPVAAHLHRAPRSRAVAWGVVERPPAVVRRADLDPVEPLLDGDLGSSRGALAQFSAALLGQEVAGDPDDSWQSLRGDASGVRRAFQRHQQRGAPVARRAAAAGSPRPDCQDFVAAHKDGLALGSTVLSPKANPTLARPAVSGSTRTLLVIRSACVADPAPQRTRSHVTMQHLTSWRPSMTRIANCYPEATCPGSRLSRQGQNSHVCPRCHARPSRGLTLVGPKRARLDYRRAGSKIKPSTDRRKGFLPARSDRVCTLGV